MQWRQQRDTYIARPTCLCSATYHRRYGADAIIRGELDPLLAYYSRDLQLLPAVVTTSVVEGIPQERQGYVGIVVVEHVQPLRICIVVHHHLIQKQLVK